MSDPAAPPQISHAEPELPEDPDHTAAFRRIMESFGFETTEGVKRLRDAERLIADLMDVSDEELMVLRLVKTSDLAIETEVARRTIAALVAFKQESATASSRLQDLTGWLIVFTAAVVLLTVVLVVRALRG